MSIAIITGASSGIGAEFAKGYADSRAAHDSKPDPKED